MKNYFAIERFSLLYDQYAIADVTDYYADQLFIKHKVTVRFGNEYRHPQKPFVIIFCKVRKRDRERFFAALAELPNKMILCGYPQYDAFCKEFIAMMEKGIHRRRKKRRGDDEIYPAGKAEQESAKSAS